MPLCPIHHGIKDISMEIMISSYRDLNRNLMGMAGMDLSGLMQYQDLESECGMGVKSIRYATGRLSYKHYKSCYAKI